MRVSVDEPGFTQDLAVTRSRVESSSFRGNRIFLGLLAIRISKQQSYRQPSVGLSLCTWSFGRSFHALCDADAHAFPNQYEAVDKWSSRIASRNLYLPRINCSLLRRYPAKRDAQKGALEEAEIVENSARFFYPSILSP